MTKEKVIMRETKNNTNEAILMDTKCAAQYIGSTEGTLRVWKSIGRYSDILQPIKTRKGIRYDQANLDVFNEIPTVG